MIVSVIEKIYAFLWGDLITIPLPQESSIGISLLVILLIPTGIYFTIRTRFLPVRLFPDMIKALMAKKETKDSLSTFQTLIVSTATRVGMGNLVGVVAAISEYHGGRSGCDRRRTRGCVLDVGDCADRFLDRICGGDARTVTQGKRSFVWRISRRSRILYPSFL